MDDIKMNKIELVTAWIGFDRLVHWDVKYPASYFLCKTFKDFNNQEFGSIGNWMVLK